MISLDLLQRRPLPASLQPLAGINESLFVHAPNSKVDRVARLCAAEALGAVYTVPVGGDRKETVARLLGGHREIAGEAATVLLDANRYSGRNRVFGTAELSPQWLQMQWDNGIDWALTDSGYVDKDADEDLGALLDSGERLAEASDPKVMIVVPADGHWASERADRLRELVEKHGVPVAYAFGSTGDPLGSKKAVQGLLHLLASSVPSVLLRTDQAAIGALAAGASLAAMGTSSTLRHIFPPRNGGFSSSGFSALLPMGLSFHRMETLVLAIAASPDALHWQCHCELCQDRTLDWIVDENQAFVHSFYALAEQARHVLDVQRPEDALASWKAQCQSAQFIHGDIEATTGMKWSYPDFLAAGAAA